MVKKEIKMVKHSEYNKAPVAPSGDTFDLAIQRAVDCHIVETDATHYCFTAIFQECLLTVLPAVSQDNAPLEEALGRAEVLAIGLFAGPTLTLPEIDALFQVVDAVVHAGWELAFLS